MREYNARLGIVLFVVYTVLYTVFVLVNTFAANLMEKTPWAGINLAILFGFGLILSAFFLALLYGFLCKSDGSQGGGKEQA